MKSIVLIFLLLFNGLCVFAQTSVKYPVKDKQVIIDIEEATAAVEGYDGNDLIIEPDSQYQPIRAQINPAGFSLVQSGLVGGDNLIHAIILKNDPGLFSVRLQNIFNNGLNFRHWHIKVPKNTHLKVIFIISQKDAKMSFRHLSNELEVAGTAPVIEFSDITGPLTLSEGVNSHRIGGTEKVTISKIKLSANEAADNEDIPFLNIITGYGDVDISLPGDAKVTVQVDAGYGSLFSDLNMMQQRPAYPVVKNRYTGNLNGGGKMIVINAAYGNIYLRKQK